MCLSVVGERTSCYGGRDGFTQVSGHNVVHLVAAKLAGCYTMRTATHSQVYGCEYYTVYK